MSLDSRFVDLENAGFPATLTGKQKRAVHGAITATPLNTVHYSLQNLKPCRKNLRSATEHPSVVDAYLRNEFSKNHLTRIQDPSILPWFQPNAFGVIPKHHKPGKWRLIVDLSAPEGYSINDFIDKQLCSISYISINHVAEAILHLGQGALLAKADVKEAFRIVPVAPEDRLLLAMRWQGELYFDKVLPFSLCSAPIIFTAIADGIEWIIRQRGTYSIMLMTSSLLANPTHRSVPPPWPQHLKPSLPSAYPPNLKSVKALRPPSLY